MSNNPPLPTWDDPSTSMRSSNTPQGNNNMAPLNVPLSESQNMQMPQGGDPNMQNFMGMMQNMMSMYMGQNPGMQQNFNQQMAEMYANPQQAQAMMNPSNNYSNLGAMPPAMMQSGSNPSNNNFGMVNQPSMESMPPYQPQQQVQPGPGGQLAGKIDQMMREEASDMDNFYHQFSKSPTPHSRNNANNYLQNSADRYSQHSQQKLVQQSFDEPDPYSKQLDSTLGHNSSLMLQADTEMIPLRSSHKSIIQEDYPIQGYTSSDRKSQQPNTNIRQSTEGFRTGRRRNPGMSRNHQPSLIGESNNSSFMNHERQLNDGPTSQRGSEVPMNSNSNYSERSPTQKKYKEQIPERNNYLSEDYRPIRPMGRSKGGLGSGQDGRYDSVPPIQDQSPDYEVADSSRMRGRNSRQRKDSIAEENEQDEEVDFYKNQPQRPEYNNQHDEQPIGGLGGGRAKTFEEMIEEQIREAENNGEQAVVDNGTSNEGTKPKRQFLKKGTRKHLSSGRVKGKPKAKRKGSSTRNKRIERRSPPRDLKSDNDFSRQEDVQNDEEEEEEGESKFKYDYKDYINEMSTGDDRSQIQQSKSIISPVREEPQEEDIDQEYHQQQDVEHPAQVKIADLIRGQSEDEGEEQPSQHSQGDHEQQQASSSQIFKESDFRNQETIEEEGDNDSLEGREPRGDIEEADKFDDNEAWDTPAETEAQKKNKTVSHYFKNSAPSQKPQPSEDESTQQDNQSSPGVGVGAPSISEEQIIKKYVNSKIDELNKELQKYKAKNRKVEQIKHELSEEKRSVAKEKAKFMVYKEEEMEILKEKRDEEMKKIKKERKISERNHKALINKPNRKEREEIETLKKQVIKLEEEKKAKEKKWRFNSDRYKRQIAELEKKNQTLEEEVLFYEKLRLQGDKSGGESKPSKKKGRLVQQRENRRQQKEGGEGSKKRRRQPAPENSEFGGHDVSSVDSRVKSAVLSDDENIEDFEKYENLVGGENNQDHHVFKKKKKTGGRVKDYDSAFDAEDDHIDEVENEDGNLDDEEDDDEDKNLLRLDIKAHDYDYSTNKFYQNYLAQKDVVDRDYTEQIGQNGKINRTYASGKSEVIFSNGARREVLNFPFFQPQLVAYLTLVLLRGIYSGPLCKWGRQADLA